MNTLVVIVAAVALAVVSGQECDTQAGVTCTTEYQPHLDREKNYAQKDAVTPDYTKFCGVVQEVIVCAERSIKYCTDSQKKVFVDVMKGAYEPSPYMCTNLTFTVTPDTVPPSTQKCDAAAGVRCTNKYENELDAEANVQRSSENPDYTKFCGLVQKVLTCVEVPIKGCTDEQKKTFEDRMRKKFEAKPYMCKGLTFNPGSGAGRLATSSSVIAAAIVAAIASY